MKDGGFVFNLGENTNDLVYSGWVYRCDEFGNFVWTIHLSYLPKNLFVDDSDNVIVTGYHFSQFDFYHGQDNTLIPYNSVKILKLDSIGKTLLSGDQTDYQNLGAQTIPAPGGNYLTCGSDAGNSNNYDLHLFLWDYKGSLIRNIALIDPSYTNSPVDMIIGSDSNYIVLAMHIGNNSLNYNMKIMKISNDTIESSSAPFNFGFNVYPSTLRATSDGKYIISGSVKNGNSDIGIYAAKINSSLQLDTFYSAKYSYDYLCNNIQDTGTILLDNAPEKNLAINEQKEMNQTFSIYPDPARDFISLSYSGLSDSRVQFSLYNILGVNVISSGYSADKNGNLNQQIGLQGIPSGCYIVELVQGNKRLLKKVMIEK